MANIALCIPTYERHECVYEFLHEHSEYYRKYGMDIYYYDSSPDDRTYLVVSEYCEKATGIYYVRMPVEMHSNAKVYKIFQQYGLKKDYDFIWVCNDAIRYSERAISEIVGKIDVSYDIIEVDYEDVEHLGLKIYEDRDLYLRDCAWKLTLYGAALLNVHTMLSGVDWSAYEEKFFKREVINFSHVSLYFNRIAEMGRFRALHIPVESDEFKSSQHKKHPGWHNDTFFIFCESWVNTIERLPECYENKKEAILKHGIYTPFLKNVRAFETWKVEGIFSFAVFCRYIKQWKKVCNVPVGRIFLISIIPASVFKYGIFKYRKKKRRRRVAKCLSFLSKYSGIVLYGAGDMAHTVASYYDIENICFDYFCVTHLNGGDREYMGHPVKEVSGAAEDLRSKGIMICTLDYVTEVIDILEQYGLSDNWYYDEKVFKAMGDELETHYLM